MIFFIRSCGYESGLKPLRDDPAAPDIQLLHYDEVLAKRSLVRGTYVFTDIDRLSTAALTEAARLFRRLQENGCTVLNDPARVRTRSSLLRKLHQEGINPINAYRADDAECPKRFPVFIRIADDHRGSLSDLICDQVALDAAIEAAVVDGFPRSTILIVEYAAQPIRPGVFRKSSVYRVGDQFIPDIWWYDTSWDIKGDRDGLAEEGLYKEELQMMREYSFAKEIVDAFGIANIDYGRLDFGSVDGKPCIYEINTYPTLYGPRPHPIRERAESINLRWTRLLAAFHAIDTEAPASQESVDVAGISVEALTKANAVSSALRFHHLRLSQEHARRGNLSAALEWAESQVAAKPNSVKALAHFSRLLVKHNRIDEAIAASVRVLEVSPRLASERAYLVNLLWKSRRFEEARDQLLEGLALDGDQWQAQLLLSRVYKKLGDKSAAFDAATRASELAPDEPSVAEWKGRFLRKRPSLLKAMGRRIRHLLKSRRLFLPSSSVSKPQP